MQGSHPDGTAVSAMDYLLDGQQTVPEGRGLSSRKRGASIRELPRLRPSYSTRAGSTRAPALERQAVISTGDLTGAGLIYVSVDHIGNQNSSPEEAAVVSALISELLGTRATWIDRDGHEHFLTLDDILVVAPYNAQVFEIQRRLPGARVGTVDKFRDRELQFPSTRSRPQAARCTTGYGLSLQLAQAERRDITRKVHHHSGRVSDGL